MLVDLEMWMICGFCDLAIDGFIDGRFFFSDTGIGKTDLLDSIATYESNRLIEGESQGSLYRTCNACDLDCFRASSYTSKLRPFIRKPSRQVDKQSCLACEGTAEQPDEKKTQVSGKEKSKSLGGMRPIMGKQYRSWLDGFLNHSSYRYHGKGLDTYLFLCYYARYDEEELLEPQKAERWKRFREPMFETWKYSRSMPSSLSMEDWLLCLLDDTPRENEWLAHQLSSMSELVRFQILGKIVPEVVDFRVVDAENDARIEFETKVGWFLLEQLSLASQTVLKWVLGLCQFLFYHYESLANPLEGGCIALMDEIDLHLDHRWQRTIATALSEVFPNIQFIVTTNSPFVLQSIGLVNLYTLKLQGNGFIHAKQHPCNSFAGWTIEEILRDVEGLESDIRSDVYQYYIRLFDEGLDNRDWEKLRTASQKLHEILHPNSPTRRMLELQLRIRERRGY